MVSDVPEPFPVPIGLCLNQAARTVEVPNVQNSVEMWQDFRDAYSQPGE